MLWQTYLQVIRKLYSNLATLGAIYCLKVAMSTLKYANIYSGVLIYFPLWNCCVMYVLFTHRQKYKAGIYLLGSPYSDIPPHRQSKALINYILLTYFLLFLFIFFHIVWNYLFTGPARGIHVSAIILKRVHLIYSISLYLLYELQFNYHHFQMFLKFCVSSIHMPHYHC